MRTRRAIEQISLISRTVCVSKFAAVILAAALTAPLVFADAIELTTGERVEGTFKQATQNGVVIEVGGQPLTIPLAKVRAIYLGTAPKIPGASASPTIPVEHFAKDSLAREALNSLKALQSVTHTGLSYREYADRVLDAKVKVDQFLRSPADRDPKLLTALRLSKIRSGIDTVMQYYELATQAWNAHLVNESQRSREIGERLRNDTVLRDCSAIRIKTTPGTDSLRTGLVLGRNPDILWSCASTKIAEVEQLLEQESIQP